MSEKNTVEKSQTPLTQESLGESWRELGLSVGSKIIVHSSLSSLGWVCGGSVAVIRSLMDVVTADGLIVMPAHSSENSEPSYWQNPAVPKEWWPIIRDHQPAFNPLWTPTRGMGAIAELFRTLLGVSRSHHPTTSFCAWGKHSEEVTDQQPMSHPMGEFSPLATLYDLDAQVLLVGVGWQSNTSLHLAEERSGMYGEINQASAVDDQGERRWVGYTELDSDVELFDKIGEAFAAKPGAVMKKQIGQAQCLLMSQRRLVDFAVEWMKAK